MPSRDVNAVTRLAEACWRRDNRLKIAFCTICTTFLLARKGGGAVIVLSLCNRISTSTFDLLFALLVPPQSENASYAPVDNT